MVGDVLASIWLGNGAKHKLDFTDLATLDRSAQQPLIDWINDPAFNEKLDYIGTLDESKIEVDKTSKSINLQVFDDVVKSATP